MSIREQIGIFQEGARASEDPVWKSEELLVKIFIMAREAYHRQSRQVINSRIREITSQITN
jgi:hypothetical protein